jgi:hypothetical protein
MELIAESHRHERADEERFRAGLPHRAAFVGDRKHIAVSLAESVVHLIDQRRERAVRVVAEIDADGIEVVAERARHAEEPDRAAASVDPLRFEKPIGLRAQGRLAAVAVIAVEQGKEILPVVREDFQPPVEAGKFVEIDQKPEQAVSKPVRLGREPAMEDRADIETGL